MKKTVVFLLLIYLAISLSACASKPQCATEYEVRPGNRITGELQTTPTIATLCTDKADYGESDMVHITFTVENGLDEQIVLSGGDRPVMDICIATDRCLSQTQAVEARLTRLEIAPGQSHTIYWDLPMSDVDLREVRSSTNVVAVVAKWLDSDGVISDIDISFSYGPRILLP